MGANAPTRLIARVNLSATGWAAVAGVWFVAVMLLAIFGRGPVAIMGLAVLALGAAGVIAGLLRATELQRGVPRRRAPGAFSSRG